MSLKMGDPGRGQGRAVNSGRTLVMDPAATGSRLARARSAGGRHTCAPRGMGDAGRAGRRRRDVLAGGWTVSADPSALSANKFVRQVSQFSVPGLNSDYLVVAEGRAERACVDSFCISLHSRAAESMGERWVGERSIDWQAASRCSEFVEHLQRARDECPARRAPWDRLSAFVPGGFVRRRWPARLATHTAAPARRVTPSAPARPGPIGFSVACQSPPRLRQALSSPPAPPPALYTRQPPDRTTSGAAARLRPPCRPAFPARLAMPIRRPGLAQ